MSVTKRNITHPRTQDIYKKALLFSKKLYELVKSFPQYEEHNVIDQIRRASSSVAANFAEGHSSYYYGKERDRLNSALCSIAECQMFLDLSRMLNYITQEEYIKLDKEAEIIFKSLERKILQLNQIIEKEEDV